VRQDLEVNSESLELAMRHRALRLLLFFGTTVLISFQLAGQSAPSKRKALVSTMPPRSDCYRKLSTADKFTAYNVTIPPHGSTELNRHDYDYLLISLSHVELDAIGAAGNSYPVRLEQEEMQVMKGGWSHRLKNLTENAARLIEIDVQPSIAPEHARCGLAATPCTDGQFGKNDEGTYATSTLFETPKMKLTRVELGSGGIFDRHLHAGSSVLIPLTRVHLSDNGLAEIDKDVGDVQVYATRMTHQLKNVGLEAARFLELEVK
jgi:hypothetical protein